MSEAVLDFVAVDFETTGFAPPKAEVIEIGAVKCEGGTEVDVFEAFIRPRSRIPPDITALTGITDETVAEASDAAAVFPRFFEFVGNLPLVAHNAGFEMRFLSPWSEVWTPSGVINTLDLARTALPNLPNHRLETVAEALGIGGRDRHRAIPDARVCGRIYLALRDAGIVDHVATQSLRVPRRISPRNSARLETLELFFEGRSIAEIAELRGVTVGTVERQIEALIAGGEIEVEDLLHEERIAAACRAWEIAGWNARLKAAREASGGRTAYCELRWVRAAHNRRTAARRRAGPPAGGWSPS